MPELRVERAEPRRLPTTRWTLVRNAGKKPNADSRQALAELYKLYQYPLYAYVRRKTGYDAEKAQDVIQGFFVRLIESQDLAGVSESRGKFRWWLLASVQHYLANVWDHDGAQKRRPSGGMVSLDTLDSEQRYKHEPSTAVTAEELYQSRWTSSLLERVVGDLRKSEAEKGKAALFDQLKGVLTSDPTLPYAQIAEQLGKTEGAIKKDAERLHRSYCVRLLAAVEDTLDNPTPEEVLEEVRELLKLLK